MVAFARPGHVDTGKSSGKPKAADAEGDFGVATLNREAQERWEDDGGAVPTARAPAADADDRPMLLNHLEVASRYFTESEHRVARQQNLISRLRAKRQSTSLAVECLRSLQASRAMPRAGCSRLQRALATLDASR